MQTLSRNTRSSSLSITLILGQSLKGPRESSLNVCACRWHEHDAEELQQSCETCIDEAVKNLEGVGFTRDSVKAIGAITFVYLYVRRAYMCLLQVSRTSGRQP
jgi:hypothetical protein